MQRREFLAAGTALLAGCAALPANGGALKRVAFGSCFDQTKVEQPVWDGVLAAKPDLFLFGGDNVYCPPEYSRGALQRAYAQAAASPGLTRVRNTIPHMALWDDHDYGLNDGGADFPSKA